MKIKIGKQAAVHMNVFFSGNNISIGSNSIINRQCYLDGRTGISIGQNVSISPQVMIISLAHDKDSKDFKTVSGEVIIDDYAWIGVRAVILQGIRLGKGSVIGAGAVVTQNVPPYTVVAGVPAKPIGKRNENMSYRLHYKPWLDSDIS